jgi:ribosomal protein S18 acetylase RimI-like enzyme
MYSLRNVAGDDYDFLYRLNKTVMKKYEDEAGGWDEEYQKKYFDEHFILSNYRIITMDGKDIGAVSIEEQESSVHICEIQILPLYQGRGIGTCIIKDIINDTKSKGMFVSLGVPKTNLRARKLYERVGLLVEGETKNHYLMTNRRG